MDNYNDTERTKKFLRAVARNCNYRIHDTTLNNVIHEVEKLNYRSSSDMSDNDGFVIEICDIKDKGLLESLKKDGINVGDVIFIEDDIRRDSKVRKENIETQMLQTAVEITRNKQYYDGLKSTAETFASSKPFTDFKIIKLVNPHKELFVTDSIADKIVCNAYSVPEMVLKKVLTYNPKAISKEDDEMTM